MESELFEEIALGNFPCFTKTEGRKAGPEKLKAGMLLDAPVPLNRKGVLGIRRKLFEMIATLTSTSRKVPAAPGTHTDPVLHPDKWYYKPVLRISSGNTGTGEKLLGRLIECESSLLLGSLIPFLSDEQSTGDAVYFGNLAIRKWNDYLKQTASAEDGQYVLRHHLFAMLCDLSERLRVFNDDRSDYVSPQLIRDFFPNEYQENLPVYPTREFTKARLARLSKERAELWDEQLTEVLAEYSFLLQENVNNLTAAGDLSESLSAVERAIFLSIFQAPFIKDHPEKISEPEFTKEWISELKKDLLKGLKPEGFSRFIHAAEQTDTILQSIPGAEVLNEKITIHSDVRSMIRSVKAVNEHFLKGEPLPSKTRLAGETIEVDKEGTNSEADKMAEEIANQFFTKDQVKKIFHIEKNDPFVAFVDRHRLSYYEASTHHHLYLRSEVMELLERIKKKRGGK